METARISRGLDDADLAALIMTAAKTGRENPSSVDLREIEIFRDWTDGSGILEPERRDGAATRREIAARFLLVTAVLDQGPDIRGLRRFVADVTNTLYRREVRFLHQPERFFHEIGFATDAISTSHEIVKQLRSHDWAADNNTNATRYNLFVDGTKQVLEYAIFRWGVPLALPLLLMRVIREAEVDETQCDSRCATALCDYVESHPSAETMSLRLKDHEKYGLGKAIGNKAAHLFAKGYVACHRLAHRQDKTWDRFSFEVPFDSNVGRVLWRTGFFLACATEDEFAKKKVIRKGEGKRGTDYIRVTNSRGMKCSVDLPSAWIDAHRDLCVDHLATHIRSPRHVFLQRLPSAILMAERGESDLDAADLDNGLIHIGTTFCFNTQEPKCAGCPLAAHCLAHQSAPDLIQRYTT